MLPTASEHSDFQIDGSRSEESHIGTIQFGGPTELRVRDLAHRELGGKTVSYGQTVYLSIE